MLPHKVASRRKALIVRAINSAHKHRGVQLSCTAPIPSLSTSHRCTPLCRHAPHVQVIAAFSTSSHGTIAPASTARASLLSLNAVSSSNPSTSSSTSSSSSSSSSSSYLSSMASISLAVLAVGAATLGLTSTSTSTASAEAASSDFPTISPLPPTLPLPRITPSPIITPTRPSPSLLSSPPRAPLPNPGKFDHNHREASNLLSSQAFAGGRLQVGLQPLPQSEDGKADKEFLLIPVISAGPDGGHGMLQIRTNLGHRHRLEAMVDTQFNVTGRYKLIHSPWVFKPSFQSIPSQGDSLSLEVDYRGKESYMQLNLLQNMSEAVLSYNQSLTRQLSAGVQLHSAPGFVNFLNLTARYTSDSGDILALSAKNQQLVASYFRTVFEQPGTPQFPPLALTMATELRVHTGNHMSAWSVGLQHTRAMFVYTAVISNEPAVSVVLEQNLGGARLQLTGEMKYDGSNESKFGIGIMI